MGYTISIASLHHGPVTYTKIKMYHIIYKWESYHIVCRSKARNVEDMPRTYLQGQAWVLRVKYVDRHIKASISVWYFWTFQNKSHNW